MDSGDRAIDQRVWTREEVCLLVAEYFRTKGMSKDEILQSRKIVSSVLRNRERVLTGNEISKTFRDESGITMQSGRIQCLDPDTPYKGMQGTKLQKEVTAEYLKNPDAIKAVAYDVITKYGKISVEDSSPS